MSTWKLLFGIVGWVLAIALAIGGITGGTGADVLVAAVGAIGLAALFVWLRNR